MAMVTPFLFQIAGFQNTGKTTLISRMLLELDSAGLKAAVLKHHGHGGEPDVEEQKDSVKHFRSGAIASIAEGDETIHLLGKLHHLEKMDAMITLLSCFKPDLILLEGYKHLSYPKAVLLKNPDDFILLDELNNIKALLCWPSMIDAVKEKLPEFPIFDINDNSFPEWFLLNYRNVSTPYSRLD
ncbi:molybdopterin-guanine dinucleotide biosynthesis protein B [Peribacillus saganii]|uniref:Molybdopterin-guanine dinucleotide biosynthesis protein B n=1 Tax=Peribacillus saganii TaxID=2303992 RepID=A0A372LM00_9BACI|nr:molybdopterin-guanine dinucleotide biosynthesis protein B [Peribacillus saganii]RFU68100.1 molybdopterin-guanine dinucleotide biosynthesis protein B [Peribacillus saganii]